MNTPITISRQNLERLEHDLSFHSVGALSDGGMLDKDLIRANVVEPDESEPDMVSTNSTVRFVDEQAEKEYELTLVYPDQAGAPGTVSIFAPVGSALLGLSVGQTIKWQVPGGRELRLRVDSVVNRQEGREQFHQ